MILRNRGVGIRGGGTSPMRQRRRIEVAAAVQTRNVVVENGTVDEERDEGSEGGEDTDNNENREEFFESNDGYDFIMDGFVNQQEEDCDDDDDDESDDDTNSVADRFFGDVNMRDYEEDEEEEDGDGDEVEDGDEEDGDEANSLAALSQCIDNMFEEDNEYMICRFLNMLDSWDKERRQGRKRRRQRNSLQRARMRSQRLREMDSLSERDFKKLFRLPLNVFNAVLEVITPLLARNVAMAIRSSRVPITPKARLASALILLGGGRPIHASVIMGTAENHVWDNLHEVVAAVNQAYNKNLAFHKEYCPEMAKARAAKMARSHGSAWMQG
jgi:hypothetical protein